MCLPDVASLAVTGFHAHIYCVTISLSLRLGILQLVRNPTEIAVLERVNRAECDALVGRYTFLCFFSPLLICCSVCLCINLFFINMERYCEQLHKDHSNSGKQDINHKHLATSRPTDTNKKKCYINYIFSSILYFDRIHCLLLFYQVVVRRLSTGHAALRVGSAGQEGTEEGQTVIVQSSL